MCTEIYTHLHSLKGFLTAQLYKNNISLIISDICLTMIMMVIANMIKKGIIRYLKLRGFRAV